MSRLSKLFEQIRDSDAFQQLKLKYDELDATAKLYVNLGAIAGAVLLVFLSLVISMARLNGLKSDINEREEMIGYLQRSADAIKQLKSQMSSSTTHVDTSSTLSSFASDLLMGAGIDPGKAEIGSEHVGTQDKETIETLADIKLSQVNLRQVQRYLFALVDQGGPRSLNIKDLSLNTKGDPSGWMDASITISSYKAK